MYARHIESVHGEWESLQTKFCLAFFPISRVIHLQKEIICFKQKEKESLGASWAYFLDLSTSGPNLALPNPMLLQHFYVALSKDSTQFLDIALGGAFLHLSTSKGRTILNKILENTPYTSSLMKYPRKKRDQSPSKKKSR